MDPSDNAGSRQPTVEAVALSYGPAPDGSTGQKDAQPADMLRFYIRISFNTYFIVAECFFIN